MGKVHSFTSQEVEAVEDDAQKTHYFLNVGKRRKLDAVNDHLSDASQKKAPFTELFNSRESSQAVEKRYALFCDVWDRQHQKIQSILEHANTSLFEQLTEYIKRPVVTDAQSERRSLENTHKLPVGLLLLGSNTANNFRVVVDFKRHISSHENGLSDIRLINLDSKTCVNIKAGLREIIKQLLSKGSEDIKEGDEENDDSQDESSDDEDDYDGRVNYDFDIVDDWLARYMAKEGSSLVTTKLRIIIVFRDTDSMNKQVLNQLLRLLHSYSTKLPIKVIMGLSSHNAIEWVDSNLTKDLRMLIQCVSFSSIDNKALGFKLINEIFLSYDNIQYEPLLLSYRLATIIYNRFQLSNNSIDSLISEIKLSYMIYFYQQPLSCLLDPSFLPSPLYVESLRKLPSFKVFIENLIFQYNKEKKAAQNQRKPIAIGDFKISSKISDSSLETYKKEVKSYLSSSDRIIDEFANSYNDIKKYHLQILNVVNIVHSMQNLNPDIIPLERIKIYQMVVDGNLIFSSYLKNVLSGIKKSPGELLQFLMSSHVAKQIGDIEDKDLIKLKHTLSNTYDEKLIINAFVSYIKSERITTKLEHKLFHEVFSLSGGNIINDECQLEENYENLMINLIRPKLRATIENGLNDPKSYLENDLIQLEHSPVLPITCHLFQVYKDAPSTINIYDFFTAFKHSLPKDALLANLSEGCNNEKDRDLIKSCSDEDRWNKLVYSWFLLSCFELVNLGFLKEKSKNDYLEKAIWINL